MKSRINFAVLVILLACCQSISAGQIVGYITDPCNVSINEYVDIVEAWVEKDGTNLTFVMVMRGTIPSAPGLPGYDDSLTYIWFVDADSDPTTGQNPVGGEFNIRAVISQNPTLAGGYVDVVGSMAGGGTGTVDVNDNKIQITINRSQIGAVRRLYWQSDAWEDIGGSYSGNGLTPMSGLARVCRYGILFDPYSRNFQVGENAIEACLETDPENPVIDLYDEDTSQENLFFSIERKYPDQDSWQIFGQSVGHSGPNSPCHKGPFNLRTFCQIYVENSDPNAYGSSYSQSHFSQDFILDGNEGETGIVPSGAFLLNWSHDYHILASDTDEQTFALSNVQIMLYQVDPWQIVTVLENQDFACNSDKFYKHEELIDLADRGLEFGKTYRIQAFLTDTASVPDPTNNAEAASDATLLLDIAVAGPEGDFDQDWDVDLFDFALFAENWLECW